MIHDRRKILIRAAPEHVFGVIESMPNKFPVYKILEPFHLVFAKKVLHVLQERAEETGSSPFRSGGSA
jgi:hypothetical protein